MSTHPVPVPVRSWRALAVVATVLAWSLISAAPAGAAGAIRSDGALRDFNTAAAGPFDDASGMLVLGRAGQHTTVTFNLTRIDKAATGTTYGAHLHFGPCVTDNGAAALGHYNTDVVKGITPPRVDETTEVWLDFTVTPGGTGHAVAQVPFVPLPGNRSVVVHAQPTAPDGTAGARLACLPVVW